MTKQNSGLFSAADFSKLFAGYDQVPVDMKSFLEAQRKNLAALSQAQQTNINGFQALAKRQSELMSQLIKDNASVAKDIMADGSPEAKMAKNIELFQSAYQQSFDNIQDITNTLSQSGKDAADILNQRVTESVAEIKIVIKKQASKVA